MATIDAQRSTSDDKSKLIRDASEWIRVLYEHSDKRIKMLKDRAKHEHVTIIIVRDVTGLHHWYAELDDLIVGYGGPYERAKSAETAALVRYPIRRVKRIVRPDRLKG